MTKKELIEAMKDYPDDALVKMQLFSLKRGIVTGNVGDILVRGDLKILYLVQGENNK